MPTRSIVRRILYEEKEASLKFRVLAHSSKSFFRFKEV